MIEQPLQYDRTPAPYRYSNIIITDETFAPLLFVVVEPRTPEREVGGLVIYLRRVSLAKTHLLPEKVLVIPRKRWLRPDMTEKLFTGT